MPVDAQLQGLLTMMQEAGLPKMGSLPAAEIRAMTMMRLPVTTEVKSVRDIEISGGVGLIPGRLYQPVDAAAGVIVYYHGGGWVIGDLDMVDPMLRILANETGCAIVSVDYRLAPEHPFPAAVDDAFAALQWTAEQRATLTGRADAPLIVMGDSAGGNLSAVVSQLARDAGGPDLALQVLIYPATEGEVHSAALHAFDSPLLDRDEIEWFCDQYIHPDQRSDPRFAPGKAASLANLPPAVVVTAEYDLLASEGRLYVDKLRAAGVKATLLDYDGAIHGFFTMACMMDIGRKAIGDVSRCITLEITGDQALAS